VKKFSLDADEITLNSPGYLGFACAGDHVDLATDAELAGEV
jgi:hypothetical protein